MRKKLLTCGLVLVGLILTFASVIVVAGYQCCNSAADGQLAALADRRPSENEAAVAAGSERISLYSVPLRCPLVEGLGCGSESKPILTKLNGDSFVGGTWLNHAGITLAVFWKDGTDAVKRSEAVASAFKVTRPRLNCRAMLAILHGKTFALGSPGIARRRSMN